MIEMGTSHDLPASDLADNPRIVSSWETLGPPPRWYRYAACHDSDSRFWFPRTPSDRRAAAEFCEACPVQRQCLEYALEHVELLGTWGGRTFEQRARIRAERQSGGGGR